MWMICNEYIYPVEVDRLVPSIRLVMLTTEIRSSNALDGELLSTSIVSTGTCAHPKLLINLIWKLYWMSCELISDIHTLAPFLASLHRRMYFSNKFFLLLFSSLMYTFTCSWLNWFLDNFPTIIQNLTLATSVRMSQVLLLFPP